MAKKDKQDKTPYFISAEFDTEGLVNLPPETKPEKLFLDTCIRAVVLYSRTKNGLNMEGHRKLFRFRDAIQKSIDAGKFTDIEVDSEAFRFFLTCWNEQNPDAATNELVIRVEKNIMEAVSRHDKQVNEENNKPSGQV